MTSREYVLDMMQRVALAAAQSLQSRATELTGTEVYAEQSLQSRAAGLTGTEVYAEQSAVPDFDPEKQYLNYKAGFVCRSPSGRMVRLLQPYDSTVYTQTPEELPAQWGFYWSQNPEDALPFVSMSTSPYMTGDCCTENGVVPLDH